MSIKPFSGSLIPQVYDTPPTDIEDPINLLESLKDIKNLLTPEITSALNKHINSIELLMKEDSYFGSKCDKIASAIDNMQTICKKLGPTLKDTENEDKLARIQNKLSELSTAIFNIYSGNLTSTSDRKNDDLPFNMKKFAKSTSLDKTPLTQLTASKVKTKAAKTFEAPIVEKKATILEKLKKRFSIKSYNRRLVLNPTTIANELEREFKAAQRHVNEPDKFAWTQAHYTRKDKCKSESNAELRKHLPGELADHLGNVGVAFVQGKRDAMEDEHLATVLEIDYKDSNGIVDKKIIPVFAVFDGHGGINCATYVKENLPIYLKNYLTNTFSTFKENILLPLFNALKQSGVELGENYRKSSAFIEGVGCTAIAVIIEGEDLWAFNIGDARAIISKNGKPIALSEDAKPDISKYAKGAEKRGGTIISKKNIFRIQCKEITGLDRYGVTQVMKMTLSTARAIGHDEELSGINPRAKVIKYPLSRLNDGRNYLIIACDGFWDVVSCNQAAIAVEELALAGMNPEQIALSLTKRAHMAGKGHDNTTVLVVDLSKWKPEDIVSF